MPFCRPPVKGAQRRLEERLGSNVIAQPFCKNMAQKWTIFFHRGLLPNGSPNARARHDQWLQSTPSQRAILEPAYILGDRKHIPEAQNAVESVLPRNCLM